MARFVTNRDQVCTAWAEQGKAAMSVFTLPKGTRVALVASPTGSGFVVDDIPLLVRLTGNRHDSHYRYVWVPAEAVDTIG